MPETAAGQTNPFLLREIKSNYCGAYDKMRTHGALSGGSMVNAPATDMLIHCMEKFRNTGLPGICMLPHHPPHGFQKFIQPPPP